MRLKKNQLGKLNLQIFNDGAGAQAPSGDASQGLVAANQERAKEVVKYGLPDEQGDVQDADVTEPNKQDNEEYDYQSLKTKFKAEFDKDVNAIIGKRFKEMKKLEREIEKSKPLYNLLSSKYGTTDADELYHALQQDDAFFEEQAMNLGMTGEQYREYLKVTTENRLLHEQIEQQRQRKEFEQKFDAWTAEAETVKSIYPNFDFSEELQNEQFFKLLNAGVNVKAAFEATHSEEILQGAIAYTAKEVAKKTANTIAKKANRPLEGGMLKHAGITYKIDPSKFTPQDRAEAVRRAERGEVIRFS